MPDDRDRRARVRSHLSRRGFLQTAVGPTGLLLLTACGGATAPQQPTAAPAKPTEAPKPAAPAAAPASSPAAAAPAAGASPAAAAAAPASSPAAAASPAAGAAAQAPAVPKVNLSGAQVSYLGWASFIPTADAFIKKQIEDWAKDVGARVSVEFVNTNDIQPKLAASIQGGSGPDIVHIRDNWAQTFIQGMSDISDLVADIQKLYGDFYPIFKANDVGPDGKWYAMPHDNSGGAMHWRQSWFKDAGASAFPEKLDAYFEVGKKLKAKNQPYGQAFGHSFGDPPGWCYSMMWGYGGREVNEQGKVAINSPETIKAVADMAVAFKDCFDDTGLAWDDSANNRSFLAEQISATQNGSSIWFVARNDKSPFFDDIGLSLMPAGPKERALLVGTDHYCIPKYSKSIDAAKELLRHLMKPEIYEARFQENQSYIAGVSPKHDQMLGWDKLPPVVKIFRDLGPVARAVGFPGPANQKAGLAWSKYIVVDMFAKAIQGESPEAAVKWAETELKQVYEV
ncbi:MAG: extracellular solute-binding protein [Chloroflexi bacterium]|nr:extracellular solute-binding protein [Chloroflexota bacterium]